MKQDLWTILDEVEAAVTDGMHLPLSDRVVVSEQELFALLDELRTALPPEIGEARKIVTERERVLSEARAQAERTITEAKDYAARLTKESAIARNAEDEAQKIVDDAEQVAERIKLEAHRYADDVLRQIQGVLQKALERVGEGRKELRVTKEHQANRAPMAVKKKVKVSIPGEDV